MEVKRRQNELFFHAIIDVRTIFAQLCVCFLFRLNVFLFTVYIGMWMCVYLRAFSFKWSFIPFNRSNCQRHQFICSDSLLSLLLPSLPASFNFNSFPLQSILTCSAYFFHIHTYMRVSKCVVCVHSVVKFKIYAIFCSLRQKAFNSFPLAFHFTSEHLAKRSSICRLIENKWIFNEDEMEWTPTIQGMLPKGGHLLKRHFIKAACAVIWHVSICYY